MRRVLRRLEEDRVWDVEAQMRTELSEDSVVAHLMGLIPGYPNTKWFY